MADFQDQGTTTVCVSHSMDTVLSLCNRAAWLDRGTVRAVGKTNEVVEAYRQSQISK